MALEHFAEMMRRRRRQVFWQQSCATANSYYFDRHGDVPLRPSTTPEITWRSGRFPLTDYRFARAPSRQGPDRLLHSPTALPARYSRNGLALIAHTAVPLG